MLFENLYEIVAKHTWPEKAEVARRDQVCREWTAVLPMGGVSFPKGEEKGCL